jgi:hypothetical protein
LEVWIFTPLLFATGYLLGRWRQDRTSDKQNE